MKRRLKHTINVYLRIFIHARLQYQMVAGSGVGKHWFITADKIFRITLWGIFRGLMSAIMLNTSPGYAQGIDSIDIKHYFYKYMNSGYVCYEKGDIDNAIYFFEIAHKTLPRDTASLLNLVYVHLDKKDYDRVLDYARRLLAIEYHRPSLYTLISSIELKKGQLNDALATIDAGLMKNPRDKMLFQMKANLLLDAGREEEAVSTIRKMIEVTGETQYYAEIGAIYENLQRYENAYHAYAACLRFQPYHVECLHGMGFLLFVRGENKKEEAYALPYEDTERFKQLIVEAKQNYIASQQHLQRALAIMPKNEAIKELLLRVERRLIDN